MQLVYSTVPADRAIFLTLGVLTPFFHYKLFQRKEIMESRLLRLGKDVIPPFSGEGDVVGWIKKVKLVQDLARFIPLFLHGDALALYLEMSNEDQVQPEQIEMRLVTAFTEGPFEAYEKLKRFKWTGKSFDVYAPIYPTPPLGQDMTQGQFLSGV